MIDQQSAFAFFGRTAALCLFWLERALLAHDSVYNTSMSLVGPPNVLLSQAQRQGRKKTMSTSKQAGHRIIAEQTYNFQFCFFLFRCCSHRSRGVFAAVARAKARLKITAAHEPTKKKKWDSVSEYAAHCLQLTTKLTFDVPAAAAAAFDSSAAICSSFSAPWRSGPSPVFKKPPGTQKTG